MARAKNPDERLDEAHFELVIAGLERDKPITKKEACAILNIAYNTTRLATLIDKYKADKQRNAERRAALRGKPATQDEIVYAISQYLEGETVDSISKSLYRSSHFIVDILIKNNVPIRARGTNTYIEPQLIPEDTIRERFAVGEVVYSAKYDCLAEIDKEIKDPRYGYIYRIWLIPEKWRQFAFQEAYELSSLEHIRKLGVKV